MQNTNHDLDESHVDTLAENRRLRAHLGTMLGTVNDLLAVIDLELGASGTRGYLWARTAADRARELLRNIK